MKLVRLPAVLSLTPVDKALSWLRQLGIREIDEGFQFMSLWGYFRDSKYVAADGCAYGFDKLRSIPPPPKRRVPKLVKVVGLAKDLIRSS